MRRLLIGSALAAGALVAAVAVFRPGVLPAALTNLVAAPSGPGAPAGGAQGGAPGTGGAGRPAARVVSVTTARAEVKPVPVRIEAIGQVQAMATVALRSRVDSQITELLFQDGATVRAGDVLVRLDQRAVEAQLRQAEAALARDAALLEQARRNVRRGEELQATGAGTRKQLDDDRSAQSALEAAIKSDQAVVDGLRVQLSYYTLTAPISGRVGVAGLRAGNIARSSEAAPALAVINQVSPIYVSFAVPQAALPELRRALAAGTARATVTAPGAGAPLEGRVAALDNAVDAATGTVGVRAVFDNAAEALWPGAITDVRLTLRVEEGVTVPREAVQASQDGTFVYVVEEGAARARAVTLARTVDRDAVVGRGLKGDETVVTDGQLLLVDGARVAPRGAPAAPAPAASPPAASAPAAARGAPPAGPRPASAAEVAPAAPAATAAPRG